MSAARWLVALAAAAPPLAAAQCDAPGAKVESDRVVVVYRTVPPRVAIGQHFAVEARVCANGANPAPPKVRPAPAPRMESLPSAGPGGGGGR